MANTTFIYQFKGFCETFSFKSEDAKQEFIEQTNKFIERYGKNEYEKLMRYCNSAEACLSELAMPKDSKLTKVRIMYAFVVGGSDLDAVDDYADNFLDTWDASAWDTISAKTLFVDLVYWCANY